MKLKLVIGVILMLGSIAGMIFWESCGRDMVMLTPVLTVSSHIREGSAVRAEDLAVMRIPKENALSGALTAGDAASVAGSYAAIELLAGQQLLGSYFYERDMEIEAGNSIFSIPAAWIYSRSSALRAGDTVRIYSMPDKTFLGSFRLAFVKDSGGQEVVGGPRREVLDRHTLSSPIAGMEIICSLSEYFRIFESVAASFEDGLRSEGPLLVVMEMGK